MKKKIYAVLGLGLFGAAVAKTLASEGHDVIAMDNNLSHVEEVSEVIEIAVQADFTKMDQLIEAGVGDCDVAIIATSSRLEDAISALLNLKKLNIPKIIVKSKNYEYREVLIKLGADHVVLPEVESGRRLGRELSNPSVHGLMEIDKQNNISIFGVLDEWIGKTVNDINFREKYGINLIAVRNGNNSNFNVEIDGSYLVDELDEFIGISKDDTLDIIFQNQK